MGRPLIGLVCCNEMAQRPLQVVATRFIEPLSRISGAMALLVPAIVDAVDCEDIAGRLDGLMLTGSRTHVAPDRYGGGAIGRDQLDPARDEVALRLAAHMISASKPVFGICRGLQEINVLFGGSLAPEPEAGGHHVPLDDGPAYDDLFAHRHVVDFPDAGLLATATGTRRLVVNSVHQQTIGQLGRGLRAEAMAEDGVIEAISAPDCGAAVLAVQWHPEWAGAACATAGAFYRMVGAALAGAALPEAASHAAAPPPRSRPPLSLLRGARP